jgi:hypothetical protein
MKVDGKKYDRFAFARRHSVEEVKTLIRLENRFIRELNSAVLPCGTTIRLASSISRYERIRLMMKTEGFEEYINTNHSANYIARMIDAYVRQRRAKTINN